MHWNRKEGEKHIDKSPKNVCSLKKLASDVFKKGYSVFEDVADSSHEESLSCEDYEETFCEEKGIRNMDLLKEILQMN
jgi:hypothetical protein